MSDCRCGHSIMDHQIQGPDSLGNLYIVCDECPDDITVDCQGNRIIQEKK